VNGNGNYTGFTRIVRDSHGNGIAVECVMGMGMGIKAWEWNALPLCFVLHKPISCDSVPAIKPVCTVTD